MRTTLAAVMVALAVVAACAARYALADPATLPLAPLTVASPVESSKSAQFIGSAKCQPCHAREHAAWQQTWHANMQRKFDPAFVVANFRDIEITYRDVEVEGADRKKVKISPTIKLSREGDRYLMTLLDKDDPANNQTYPIVFVLGGNWEQHFDAQVGANVFPTPMRWVIADGQWRTGAFNNLWWVADGTIDGRPKKPSEMPISQVGDAKCDGCHTTGYAASKDSATGRWRGKYVDDGIGCEACHGAGSIHVQTPTRDNIVNPIRLNARQQDQVCAQCHSRVTNKSERELAFPQGFVAGNIDLHDRVEFWTYSTQPGNFWPNEFANKNRQQYHDVRLSQHEQVGVTCITCHDVHSTQKGYAQVRGEKNELCASCHQASKALFRESTMASVGVGCTDCHMARIANRAGATAKTKTFWDVTSHTFRPVMAQEASDYKMRASCDSCHEGEERTTKSATLQAAMNDARQRIDGVRRALTAAKAKGRNVADAQALLDEVLLDRSSGAHNPQKAVKLLDAAMARLAASP